MRLPQSDSINACFRQFIKFWVANPEIKGLLRGLRLATRRARKRILLHVLPFSATMIRATAPNMIYGIMVDITSRPRQPQLQELTIWYESYVRPRMRRPSHRIGQGTPNFIARSWRSLRNAPLTILNTSQIRANSNGWLTKVLALCSQAVIKPILIPLSPSSSLLPHAPFIPSYSLNTPHRSLSAPYYRLLAHLCYRAVAC